jgi:flagellar motility protein MotE (MotC chaperone)
LIRINVSSNYRKKRDIDQEIDAIRDGHIIRLSDTALRDRAQQVECTAMDLLRDFREVENNFRQLDKEVREKIATWDGRKGQLLEEILQERDAISDSDQGRSFQAFWNFLMPFDRQAELTEMLVK